MKSSVNSYRNRMVGVKFISIGAVPFVTGDIFYCNSSNDELSKKHVVLCHEFLLLNMTTPAAIVKYIIRDYCTTKDNNPSMECRIECSLLFNVLVFSVDFN